MIERFSPWFCAALLAAASAGRAPGQGAPTTPISKTPYQLHFVILSSDHRFLATEQFQQQFPRELIQRTKLALGDLVHADASMTHELSDVIHRDGLDAALENYDEVSSRRTWFFVLRVRNGQFEIQGRYFDGLTGTAGPRSTTLTTGDRSRLAALAAGMVADRFPYVGTVMSVKGDNVELSILGSDLADTGISRGAIFAVSRIAFESGKYRARRIPWAALEVDTSAANGTVAGRYWRRFVEDSISPMDGVIYRAILLPTISAPVELRIVDRETSQPLAGIAVSVQSKPRDFELVSDAAGGVTSPEALSGLAIIKLSRGGAAIAQLPVPIVDDRPTLCDISPRADADDVAGLEIRKMQFVKRMLETLRVVDQRFGEQQVLLNQSLETSLDHAKGTLQLLDREIEAIRAERAAIRAIEQSKTPNQKQPEDGDRGIAHLNQLRQSTSESIDRITQAIRNREEQSEKQRQAVKLWEQASLLESQSQFDEAIAQFKKAAELLPESTKIRERLMQLDSAWAIKSEEHREARNFLIVAWPKLDAELLKHNLPMAKKHLEICQKVDDRLTPRRVLAANLNHHEKIAKIAEQLKKSRNVEDQRQLLAWKEVRDSLRNLTRLASDLSQPAIEKKKD